jgi:prevent-host-death family protein
MKEVGVKEARQHLPGLLDRVEAGEEVVITRHGRAVAKLTSARTATPPLPALEEFRRRIARGGTPAAELLREERELR